MLTEPTLDKLKELSLYGMADTYLQQRRTPSEGDLSFEDRFGLLVDAEWMLRQNKRLKRRLSEAKLRLSNTDNLNILISGATGTGKTFLACALAQQACRKGYRALYRRASRLYEEMALARADGTYPKLLSRLLRVDVLVLDDFGLASMRDADRQGLLDVLEDRHGNSSTIVTSQLPPRTWYEYLGDPTVADSICDRLLHTAHRVELKGPSRRRPASRGASHENSTADVSDAASGTGR